VAEEAEAEAEIVGQPEVEQLAAEAAEAAGAEPEAAEQSDAAADGDAQTTEKESSD
jgi:hypothetical protein